MQRIVDAVSRVRVTGAPQEADLHALIAEALAGAQIGFSHEARLGPRMRADFLAGRVAIEIKKGRPAPAALKKQIGGYLACPGVDEMLVITQRRISLPKTIGGKPVHQLALDRLWGIALK